MAESNILEHYHESEHSFVEKVVEWSKKVAKEHIPILTDFVDPRQKEIIQNIVNTSMDLTMFFDGCFDDAERVRVLIAPDYWIGKNEDMQIAILEANVTNKFKVLHHGDYLGALMGIGVKREKFGDILLNDTTVQFIVAEEITSYVQMELKQAGRLKLDLKRIEREQCIPSSKDYDEQDITVSSNRLDSIAAQVFQLSRTKIDSLIKANMVKINWKIEDKSNRPIKKNDMISVRGFGRFKMIELMGETKKGKLKIKIGKLS